jgi:hypothetical protein
MQKILVDKIHSLMDAYSKNDSDSFNEILNESIKLKEELSDPETLPLVYIRNEKISLNRFLTEFYSNDGKFIICPMINDYDFETVIGGESDILDYMFDLTNITEFSEVVTFKFYPYNVVRHFSDELIEWLRKNKIEIVVGNTTYNQYSCTDIDHILNNETFNTEVTGHDTGVYVEIEWKD